MKEVKVKTDVVINNYIDIETGEIIDQDKEIKHHKILVDDKESFFWTYLSILKVLDDLDKVSIKVLYFCNMHSQWNTNKIALTKPILKDIEIMFDIKYQTIRNSISKLKKLGVLIDLGSATYRINPRYYWKGDTQQRTKNMQYILEIECISK